MFGSRSRLRRVPALHACSFLARHPDAKASDADGLVVVLDLRGGRLLELNGVGSEIWMMLSAPKSVDAVCAALVDAYDVGPAEVARDVFPFLQDLIAVGALCLSTPEPSR